MKSVVRILIAVTIILIVAVGLLLYTNMLTGGKTLARFGNGSADNGNSTVFYLTGGKVTQPWLNGYDLHGGYFGSGGTLTVYDNWRYNYTGDVMVIPNIILQRKVGSGKWATVATQIPFDKGLDIHAPAPAYKVPAGQKSVKVSYRLGSLAYKGAAGMVKNTSYSTPITVTYENQAAYTGLAKTIYNQMRTYCPTAAVHVISGRDSSKNEAGNYTEGQLLIQVNPKISTYSTANKKSVALHECAHERQFLNYGGTATGWAQMTADAQTIFKDDVAPSRAQAQRSGANVNLAFNAVEHAADCAAYAENRGGYLGYGGYCNASELKAGRALLTGHRLR